MEPAQYTDPLEDALSHGSQRVAQLASLVAAMAQVVMQRRALEDTRRAMTADDPAARALDAQERALHQQARMSWAPAHDQQWLSRTDLIEVASTWADAAAWADTDPAAASALRKCEERLRRMHPFAMAHYDRLRNDGLDPLTAMREAAPLFAYSPTARPGSPAPSRAALISPTGQADQPTAGHDPEPSATMPEAESEEQTAVVRGQQIIDRLQAGARAAGRPQLGPDDLAMVLDAVTNLPSGIIDRLTVQAGAGAPAGRQSDQVARTRRPRPAAPRRGTSPHATATIGDHALSAAADSQDHGPSGDAREHVAAGRTAAELAAESFPRTAAEAVKAAAGQAQRTARAPSRTQIPRQAKRPRRSP